MAQSVYDLILVGVGGRAGQSGWAQILHIEILVSSTCSSVGGLWELDLIALIGQNTTLSHIDNSIFVRTHWLNAFSRP